MLYGMNFPKQEKACEALGFERPNPEKKSNKFNNAKMVFDEEVRKLYIEIAEKYGVVIEKIPLEGKKHLEKMFLFWPSRRKKLQIMRLGCNHLN